MCPGHFQAARSMCSIASSRLPCSSIRLAARCSVCVQSRHDLWGARATSPASRKRFISPANAEIGKRKLVLRRNVDDLLIFAGRIGAFQARIRGAQLNICIDIFGVQRDRLAVKSQAFQVVFRERLLALLL